MSATAFARLAPRLVEEMVVVCCGCQRLRLGPLAFGRRVEANVDVSAESISHTLCPECAERHYGFSRERYAAVVCKAVEAA